jgi:hypothetical protein
MPRTRISLWKKDKLQERNAENLEKNILPREWTQAELGRMDRILPTLWRLQGVLPVSKDEGEEAIRFWTMIQEVARIDSRLIDAISQNNRDVLKFGNQEAILETLIRSLEELMEKLDYSYIHEAYQMLKQEQMIKW